MNEYVAFYEKYKISPVRQNINNFDIHCKRREGLYRQLGLPKMLFKGKDVLEVGSGGGYNSLATYLMKPSRYVLIEPNKAGFNELLDNFNKRGFKDNVEFYNILLEDFDCKDKFDIVLCEGLIQGLSNRESFLKRLSNFVKKDGFLVITVADEISMFFEILRRYLANELIKNEKNFEGKINILVRAFTPHLDSIKGMTRKYEDWCADLICDAIYNHTFSIVDAIGFFKRDYFFYGASPNIFQDFRWYKSLPIEPTEYNEYFIKQFNSIRHNFINYLKIYREREEKENIELSMLCKRLILIVKSLEKNDNQNKKREMIEILEAISNNLKQVDKNLSLAIHEFIKLSKKENLSPDEVRDMKFLKPLFGRGQIYLSFVKEE
ncbi:class I SAM-dependent methyltransferase [Hippea jasoniae]|uniref:class I SAM-dependent methyltransferase n=1 Tax=Hippea jasoniae TaxID=944479 RepID=UPI00054D226F|nr:methyltransferase domain-containing protein [Hippea jasoniae]